MPTGRFHNVGWTVGNYCNAQCGHCYSRPVRQGSHPSLTERDMVRVLEQLLAMGVKTVNIGGNEPIFTHGPDPARSALPFLLRQLHGAGLPVGITTNGVSFHHLHTHHRDVLALVNDIDFSLDFPFEAQHDASRRARLFRLVVDGIQQCRALGLHCAITVCGTRRSFQPEMLGAFLDLCALLGCELRVNLLKPVIPALLPQMPTRDQFYAGFAFLLARTECLTLAESCLSAFTGTGLEGCPCGRSSFRINGLALDGTLPVGPCIYTHDFRTGDLLNEPLAHIVERAPFRRFQARAEDLPADCRGCSYAARCRGGCTARTWFVSGRLDARDPYCPLEYVQEHGGPPPLPASVPIRLDGLRVHDNYLCTWIGRVRADHVPRRTTMAEFLADGGG